MSKRISLIWMILCLLFTACNSPAGSAPTPTPQIDCGGFPPPQQPHSETTFEDMVTLLNTVNANVFESGNFKEIIDRTRADGYILRPYFDNRPAALQADKNGDVSICPRYDGGRIPPGFMYHLREGKQSYQIEITYIEEEFISAAEENGFAGFYAARNPETASKNSSPRSHYTVMIGDTEKNITVTASTNGFSYGEFVWEKYLIRVSGNLFTTGQPDATINTDLFSHLSFRKMRLNPKNFWPSSPRYGQKNLPLPHQEKTAEKMAAFLNSADAETFAQGNLKELISQAKADGYILEPYYDGKKTYLHFNGTVMLAPSYFEGDTSLLLYPCLDGELDQYTVQICYLSEQLLPIAKEGGALALYAAANPDISKEDLAGYQKTEYQTENYTFSIIEMPEGQGSYAEIMLYDRYLIQIFGDFFGSMDAHQTIQPQILDHLSFHKLPLSA